MELYQESVMRSCVDCQDLQDWNQIISEEKTTFCIPTLSLIFTGNGSKIYSLCSRITIMIRINRIPSLKQDLLHWMTFLSQSCASWLGSVHPVERKFVNFYYTVCFAITFLCEVLFLFSQWRIIITLFFDAKTKRDYLA